MRVLGVDPGLTRCGLGVVESDGGRRVRMVAVGVVRTPVGDDPQERLLTLQTEIDEWLAEHRPDAVAVERVFAKANIKGIMGTAQASAVPMLAAARLGLPLALHTPTEVKAAVTGNGRADKAQVTLMITRILGLDTPPRPADAADALALAVCHLWRGQADARLQDAAQGNALQRAAGEAARSGRPRNRLEELHAAHPGRRRSGAPAVKATAVKATAVKATAVRRSAQ
ncbi:crossover junction endodeoxyribonuclease RuvC [Ornithinimicrobium cryptoxanthini]|uniref:Crossover junction endodeoxyribonuclease RuvC n=1 Tax=Ornithinimicrobium cryptoxanthini TaxID=2934161 RepID=A0ABY4YMB9_9MICO|nr:crossover junction endodeoxyribonuclease RuvC [Ornithinimicrobium cryptoxanthini]USQ77873.1 crossover junction endodeoxyribonuclease RuvC [Ornithinimicrobium cryptoxanthini]